MSETFGWVHDPREVDAISATLPHPVMDGIYGDIKNSGEGRTVLLYKFVEKAIGRFNVRTQAIGDCVSFGAAGAIDVLKAVQGSEWVAETSTEDIYGGSRVLVGGGRLSGDGSVGAWAAKYANEYGTLVRKSYGSFDLSNYSGQRARDWGFKGTPHELLPFAKEHLVKVVTRITSVEQARDAIANGYPVTVASNQGFTKTRDKDGFASPSGSWPHQMYLHAVDDVGVNGRKGVCCQNSWGPSWISGPKRFDQPDGSFWVDYNVLAHMISSGDCWSFSSLDGFKKRKLTLIW